jgi:hypothetical protein
MQRRFQPTGVDAVGGLLAVVVARAAAVPRLQVAALRVLLSRGGDLVARLSTAPLTSVRAPGLLTNLLQAQPRAVPHCAT